MNRYKADLRELRFLLFEQIGMDDVFGRAPFESFSKDDAAMVIDAAYQFACEVLGPINASGDREGCRLENGEVKTPRGYKEAWDKMYEAGWPSILVDQEHGGQGAPHALAAIVEEFMSGANTAFNMYPGLAAGAAFVIELFGTDAQKAKYLPNMRNGKWGGTMCLTEPHAGSDVGAAKSSARRLEDGTYAIKGNKIFISCGDSDLAENVVHLVLARVDGAAPGTKGLSLFVVPKKRIEADGSSGASNAVVCTSIEHKMGINGSATCALSFGEDGECVGELLGHAPHQGMPQMFKLMNGARISVGVQGVAVASSAYLNALQYAKERKQGASMHEWKDPTAPRVAIIEHPDVRRMLLDMKSRVEGIRALIVKLAKHMDLARVHQGKDDQLAAYHQGQVDLLVPLVKAYGSDQSFRVCETAIQTYGGMGYTKDAPVEQACRDAKIFSIYEGTNHIQAMDLVGRKLPQNGGANLQAFLGDVARFASENAAHPTIGPSVKELEAAHEALAGTAMRLLGWFQQGQLMLVPLAANRFLEMMSVVAVGWMLLEGARVATSKMEGAPPTDKPFYEGKVAAAKYFATNVLPTVKLSAEILGREDRSAIAIPDEAFAGA